MVDFFIIENESKKFINFQATIKRRQLTLIEWNMKESNRWFGYYVAHQEWHIL
jgi:hypothetical protein